MATPKLKILCRLLVTVIITILALTCQGINLILSGERLDTGQALDEGSYSFVMQASCNLALYDGSEVIYTSNAGLPNRICRAYMQRDGNFVIYDRQNNVVWASNTWQGNRPRNYVLVLQKDRNAAIYGPGLWSTGTNKHKVVVNGTAGGGFIESQNVSTMIVGEISHHNATAVRKTTSYNNILLSGQTLDAGESLDQGSYSFKMQDSCNLALYDGSEAIYTSNRGFPNRRCSARMQRDGNFVIYDEHNNVVWASNTWQGNQPRNYVLVLQKDRNVAIYGPGLWSTGTNKHKVVVNGTVGGGFVESQNVSTMIVGGISRQNAPAV